MKKHISVYDGEDISTELQEFAQEIINNPKMRVIFNIDYSGCYYTNYHPSYELIITDEFK